MPSYQTGDFVFKRGDILLKVEGVSVESEKGLDQKLVNVKDIDKIKIGYRRDGQVLETTVSGINIYKKIPFVVDRESQIVNAYVNLRGIVTVNNGLIRFSGNENELAFVIAHELAHVFKGHVGKGLANNMIASAAGIALGSLANAYVAGTGNLVATLTANVIRSPYSKVLEKEADYYALQLLMKAGFDTEEGYQIWERFAVELPASQQDSIMASHPSSPERLVRMQENFSALMNNAPQLYGKQEERTEV